MVSISVVVLLILWRDSCATTIVPSLHHHVWYRCNQLCPGHQLNDSDTHCWSEEKIPYVTIYYKPIVLQTRYWVITGYLLYYFTNTPCPSFTNLDAKYNKLSCIKQTDLTWSAWIQAKYFWSFCILPGRFDVLFIELSSYTLNAVKIKPNNKHMNRK